VVVRCDGLADAAAAAWPQQLLGAAAEEVRVEELEVGLVDVGPQQAVGAVSGGVWQREVSPAAAAVLVRRYRHVGLLVAGHLGDQTVRSKLGDCLGDGQA